MLLAYDDLSSYNNDAVGGWGVFKTAAPSLSVTDTYAKKGAAGVVSEVSIPVSLDIASALPVTFHYETLQATEARCENAIPAIHYIEKAADITILPSVTQINITVGIIGNNEIEFPGRRFYVKISAIPGAANTPATSKSARSATTSESGFSMRTSLPPASRHRPSPAAAPRSQAEDCISKTAATRPRGRARLK